MKISTKGRYALRLMLDLAVHGGDRPLPLRDVAKRQEISEKYLEQLVSPLIRASLLRSVRGAAGGYLLTRSIEKYTVGEILRTQEGSLAPVECAEEHACCERMEQCVTVDLWRQVKAAVDNVVDSVTLHDLTQQYYAKCPNAVPTFPIT